MQTFLVFLALTISKLSSANALPSFECQSQDKKPLRVIHGENGFSYEFPGLFEKFDVEVSRKSWVGDLLTIDGNVDGLRGPQKVEFKLDIRSSTAELRLINQTLLGTVEEKYELICAY